MAFIVYLRLGRRFDPSIPLFREPAEGLTNQYKVNDGLRLKLVSRMELCSEKSVYNFVYSIVWFLFYKFFQKQRDTHASVFSTVISLSCMFTISANQIWTKSVFDPDQLNATAWPLIFYIAAIAFSVFPFLFVISGRNLFVKYSKKLIDKAADFIPDGKQKIIYDL